MELRKKTFIIILIFVIYPCFIFSQDLTNIKDAKPIIFSGNLEARSIAYNATGIENRRDPFSYIITGSPTVSLYGWSIPFSFAFSKEQKSFRQPFNQFGMSPTYKWITLHAGYRNLNFSPYTLAGHTMLGAGFELKPKKFRTAFMYGKLNRATVIDTTTNALVPFSFSRLGYAAKLGYGTDANFFDLSFLKAQDDSTSRPSFPLGDDINVLAASNGVLGFKSRFSFLKKFFLESDGAVSLYTRDVNSPLHLDSLEDKFLNRAKNIFNVNGSSEWYTALNVGAGFKEKYYGLKLNYKRIEPGFKTMGAYYFGNDLEAWLINPSFSLPSGKLRGNVSVGIQRDNIKEQKQATNKRLIGTANITAQFTERLGLDFNYSNFSNNQAPKTLSFADSLKIVQTTQVISIMPRYMIVGPDLSHMFMVSANLSGMKDYNNYFDNDAEERNITTQQFFFNYTISFPKKRVSVFTNLNYTELIQEMGSHKYQGFSLGGNYAIPNNKAQVGVNSSFMQGISDVNGKSLIVNASLNGSYKVDRNQTLRVQMYLTNNNPGSVITNMNPAFTETRGELAYMFNF